MNEHRKLTPPLQQQITFWLLTHLRCLLTSLGQMIRSPAATILTISVIGIALALPAGLSLVLNNISQFTATLDNSKQISLYLKKSTDEAQIRTLQHQLEKEDMVESVQYISRDQALTEFRQNTDQESLINLLDENPLPATLVIDPDSQLNPDQLNSLIDRLQRLPEVELVQFDQGWARRLHALVQLLQKFVLVLTVLLMLGVLLIIGNTIRVGIQSRYSEIQISRLFGATRAFIRRPFLYSGMIYGLFGGIIACLLLISSYMLLADQIVQLISAYQLEVSSGSRTLLNHCLSILLAGAMLGVISSWLVVAYYQRDLENNDFT